MPIFGFLSLIFGIVVLLNPDIIAYLIGFFFIFVGINILALAWMTRRGKTAPEKKWQFGEYEIIKKRK